MLIEDVKPEQEAEARLCFNNNVDVFLDVAAPQLLGYRQPTTSPRDTDPLLQHPRRTVESFGAFCLFARLLMS